MIRNKGPEWCDEKSPSNKQGSFAGDDIIISVSSEQSEDDMIT
jgi:hypothetical protein